MRIIRSMRLWLLGLVMLSAAAASLAEVNIAVSIRVGPPALPVYTQPFCPGPGYIWTPGYWAYGPAGYYWVPGTWVMAPAPGLLWTPGYWGWGGGGYIWHAGYWGPHVGFYGGINYGFGYTGVGFVGGRWDRNVFVYNTAVTRVNTTVIHTTYVDRTVIRNVSVSRVSYNGGVGGLNARANAEEESAFRERHMAATAAQEQHERFAGNNHASWASVNHGRPTIAATSRPGEFGGRNVMPAREAAPHPGGNPRSVPRPPARETHFEAGPAHANAGPQHNAPHPQGGPHGAEGNDHRGADMHREGDEHHGNAEHHDAGQHHDDRGGPR